MADEQQVKILIEQGAFAWNEWREENKAVLPDLREADLSWAVLEAADLRGATLSGALLYGAELNMGYQRSGIASLDCNVGYSCCCR